MNKTIMKDEITFTLPRDEVKNMEKNNKKK